MSLKSKCWLGRLQLGVDYECDSVSQLGGLTSFCMLSGLTYLLLSPWPTLQGAPIYSGYCHSHPAPILGYSILGIELHRYLHTLLSRYKSVCGPEPKSGTSGALMVQASRLLTLYLSFTVSPVDH